MNKFKNMLVAALGILATFDSNAANARIDTSALDNVIIKSYPQHQFGNVLAFQFMQNGQPMVGVLKNGDWREELPCPKNVVQISIKDVMKASCKINNCKKQNCFTCYTDILALNNEHNMNVNAFGFFNQNGYDDFSDSFFVSYSLLSDEDKVTTFNDMCNLTSYQTRREKNRAIRTVYTGLMDNIQELSIKFVNNTQIANSINQLANIQQEQIENACEWWSYAMHTEVQFDALCTIANTFEFSANNIYIPNQWISRIVTSKYEPCKSCKQLDITKTCDQFRFLAVDKAAGFDGQYTLNMACIWNDFCILLTQEVANELYEMYQDTKVTGAELVRFNQYKELINKFQIFFGCKVKVSKDGKFY